MVSRKKIRQLKLQSKSPNWRHEFGSKHDCAKPFCFYIFIFSVFLKLQCVYETFAQDINIINATCFYNNSILFHPGCLGIKP